MTSSSQCDTKDSNVIRCQILGTRGQPLCVLYVQKNNLEHIQWMMKIQKGDTGTGILTFISLAPWDFIGQTLLSAPIGCSMQLIRALLHHPSGVTDKRMGTTPTRLCVCSMLSISI